MKRIADSGPSPPAQRSRRLATARGALGIGALSACALAGGALAIGRLGV